jgi:hypothetical protein
VFAIKLVLKNLAELRRIQVSASFPPSQKLSMEFGRGGKMPLYRSLKLVKWRTLKASVYSILP